MSTGPLLEVSDLTVTYPGRRRSAGVTAVSGVSFDVLPGQTVSVVGESGSGKTTIGSTILGLQAPSAGVIRLDGHEITGLRARERRALTTSIQAVFQDPYSSLDPSQTVGEAVAEPLRAVDNKLSRTQIREQVQQMLERVGINAAAMSRYPAEFSGGQRQRIAIARALVVHPRLVVCDEAVSALDVSVQAQVLNLLESLQRAHGTSYLFISHNMAVVRHISDRVVVLYRGRVMEQGPADAVCDRPAHPYTRSLLAAVPVPDVARQRERRELRSRTSRTTVADTAAGCPFVARCPFAADECRDAVPPLVEVGDGWSAACIRLDTVAREPADLAIGRTGS